MSDADLVARLRAAHRTFFYPQQITPETPWDVGDLLQAAAAIERLRAALKTIRDIVVAPGIDKYLADKYLDVSREIAREALAGAGDDPDYGAPCSRCGKVTCECST